MPNTQSAIRRTRNSARRALMNRSSKTRLKTLEAKFSSSLKTGKKEEAQEAFRSVVSALDKAAKTGVIHQGKADRKKSRLAIQLGGISKGAKAEAKK